MSGKMVEFYSGTIGKKLTGHPEVVIAFEGRVTARRIRLIKQILMNMIKPDRRIFYIARVWDDETGKNELNVELIPEMFGFDEDGIYYDMFLNTSHIREFIPWRKRKT